MSLASAVAQVAPLYNLGLVVIALALFVKLFRTPIRDRRVYLMPWKLIFGAFCVYIVEAVLTVLRGQGLVDIPIHINGFFEVLIIVLFIYALLLQKEHVRK